MIAYIEGEITYKTNKRIIVAANGIGYELQISTHTYEFLKDVNKCKIYTYWHVTQEAHILFGFADVLEKKCFLNLLTVNGIGPRGALTILSALQPANLVQAIATQNMATLQTIKGVGKKAAQRIILELQSKVKEILPDYEENEQYSKISANTAAICQEALAALMKLGIHKQTAEKNIATIISQYQGELSTSLLVKMALTK